MNENARMTVNESDILTKQQEGKWAASAYRQGMGLSMAVWTMWWWNFQALD